jgi:hypothetical protein
MVVHHWVDARANEDRYLRAKVNAIKTRLAAFDPAFDEDFWKRIDAIRRDTRTYLTP